MRHLYRLILLSFILLLTACGSEEVMTPPVFSTVTVRDSLDLTKVLTSPFSNSQVTIMGTIDDVSAKIVASNTVSGEVQVPIVENPVGSKIYTWSFAFAPAEGANLVTFTASDQDGNINQMILTVTRDTTPPVVSSVSQNLVDPLILIVTFNEALLESSVTVNPFAVAGSTVTSAILDTILTKRTVTLTLSEALPAGSNTLTCTGVTDLAGNSVAIDSPFVIPVP